MPVQSVIAFCPKSLHCLPSPLSKNIVSSSTDAIPFQTSVNNPLSDEVCRIISDYIAGFIVKNLRGKVCGRCSKALFSQIDVSNKKHSFFKKKPYSHAKRRLSIPSEKLSKFVAGLEVIYQYSKYSGLIKKHLLEDLQKHNILTITNRAGQKFTFLRKVTSKGLKSPLWRQTCAYGRACYCECSSLKQCSRFHRTSYVL